MEVLHRERFCFLCNLVGTAILKWHKLSLEDFPGTLEEQRKAAFEAADQYSKMQRSLVPMISEKHPDIIMPNGTCSLFWHVMHEGNLSTWLSQHSQEYDMSTKLATNGQQWLATAEHGQLVAVPRSAWQDIAITAVKSCA